MAAIRRRTHRDRIGRDHEPSRAYARRRRSSRRSSRRYAKQAVYRRGIVEQRHQWRAEKRRVARFEDDRSAPAAGASLDRRAGGAGSAQRAISAEESLRQGPDIVVHVDDGDPVAISREPAERRIARACACNARRTRGPSGKAKSQMMSSASTAARPLFPSRGLSPRRGCIATSWRSGTRAPASAGPPIGTGTRAKRCSPPRAPRASIALLPGLLAILGAHG